ncbi:uncharacterized protein [Physcomitrium patens]|nr:uncharacterized protein LOC112295086 isoform X3 [Physcomitrium patens]|eukprot:XP_024402019.1 uncharacterized protein LOC112295086 isoform X3 [Physcomitrella patens]
MCIFSSSKPETRKVRSIQQRKLAGHGRKNLPPQAQFICLGQLLCCSRLQRSLIPRLRKFLLAGQMLTACEMLNMLQSPLNSFSEFISNEIQMKWGYCPNSQVEMPSLKESSTQLQLEPRCCTLRTRTRELVGRMVRYFKVVMEAPSSCQVKVAGSIASGA